jgi:hypothetical protein
MQKWQGGRHVPMLSPKTNALSMPFARQIAPGK